MSRGARLGLILGAPLAALALLWAAPRRLDLVVVNPLERPVTITVGAEAPVVVPAASATRLPDVRAGELTVVARAGEAELARATARCPAEWLEPRRTWVVSVAPVTSWWVVSRGYGDRRGKVEPPAPFTPDGALFALPPDVLDVDAPLPDDLRVPNGVTGATRRVLWSRGYVERGATVSVIVDNTATQRRLRLELDGAPRGTCAPWSLARLDGVPAGPVRLAAVELGADDLVLGRYEVEGHLEVRPLEPSTYVWNVGGAGRYWVVCRRYGPPPAGDPGLPPPRPFPAAELFAIPPDFFPGLDEPLPETWRRAGLLEGLWTQERLRASRRREAVVPFTPRPR